MRNRAQTFVKENKLRSLLPATADPQHFQFVAANVERKNHFFQIRNPHQAAFLSDLCDVSPQSQRSKGLSQKTQIAADDAGISQT
jgi:hypothetical protein